MKPLLNLNTAECLEYFISLCSRIGLKKVTINEIRDVAKATVKHLNNPEDSRLITRQAQELEFRWYESIKLGSPDYGVYSEEIYLAEMIACYICYSRKHLQNIQKPNSLFDRSVLSELKSSKRVLDLGSGISLTTCSWAQMFPKAKVWAYDFPESPQAKIANLLAKEHGFAFVSDFKQIDGADFVFASEYFEHILDPIPHANELIDTLKPKYWLIANSFGAKAVGHFDRYLYQGKWLDPKRTSKLFNMFMKYKGYEKVQTKLWNSRPSFWVKQ